MHNKYQPLKSKLILSTTSLVIAILISPSASWGQERERQAGHLPYIVTETEKGEEAKSTNKCQKPAKKVHFWGTLSGGETKDNLRIVKLKGPSYYGQLGVDYKIDGFKVGAYVSEGYNRQKAPQTDLVFKSRARTTNTNVFAFAAYYFSKEFFVNVLGGYSYNPTKSNRLYFQNVHVKSKTNIYSIAPNLNYQKVLGKFVGSFKIGYLYTNTNRKKTIDSTGTGLPGKKSNMSSGNFLADFGYTFKNIGCFANSIVPYIQGGINHDFKKTLQKGQTGLNLHRNQDSYLAGSGLRVYFKKDVTLSAGWTIVAGNTKKVNNTATITLRVGAF